MDYNLDEMIERFEIHSKRAIALRKIHLDIFPEAEYLKEDFCITKALLFMCQEIKSIKEKL